MLDAVMGVVAIVGGAMVLLSGAGVLRFPDLYARMHAATKASTVGIGFIGVSGAAVLGDGRSKTLVAVAFIFVTAPSAAHLVARAAYRAEGIDIDLESRDDLADLVDDDPHPADPGG